MKNKIVLRQTCWKEPENGNKHVMAIPISSFEISYLGKPRNY